MTIKIQARENGPYLLPGDDVVVVDQDGKEYDTAGRAMIALCRCGGSTTKPFCDGTHSKVGFAAAERAVAASEDGSGTAPAT